MHISVRRGPSDTVMLDLTGVRAGYGELDVLKDVSISVASGELVVIVGPNGAGKSTVLKTVAGLLRPKAGRVAFNGRDIGGSRPDQIAALGIGYVPQERNVFAKLSVRENLEMGAFLGGVDTRSRIAAIEALVPGLRGRESQAAGSLSGGDRQFVAIGRALMRDPAVLMLDEPTAGLSPKFAEVVFAKIREINGAGIAVLMVEQNARRALEIADRGYVLALGTNRHEDTGQGLLDDPEVGRLFLGG